jgi:hypothetical protein
LTSAVSGTITATVSAPTVTTGDIVSLTFTNSNLGNNPVTVTYNVGGADTAATITSGLITQINGNSDLAAAGLTATTSGPSSNVFTLIDSGTSQAQTTITQSETGSSSESITLSSANTTTDTVTLPTPPTLIGETLNFGNGGSLSGGGSALTNIDNTISGAGTIGDASMTLTNSVNGIINASGINALHLNAGLLLNSGLIESTKTGGLVIGADNDAVNNGTIAAAVGLIDVQSALSGTGTAKISGTAQIKFEAANTHQNVVFAASTGEELFLNSQTFSGNISGFTGTDSIDLEDISFAANTTTATYTPNSNLGGTLAITDGTHTTDLSMVGTYSQASFNVQSDGHGGTLLLDPPVDTANHSIASGATVTIAKAGLGMDTFAGKSGTLVLDLASDFAGKISGFGGRDRIDLADIGFGAQTTLGYSANGNGGGTLTVSDAGHIAKIALLGNYMASSFAVASDGHGGTFLEAAASTPGQNALALPHA